MEEKKKILVNCGFFVVGIILIFIGLAYGEELGSVLSRPYGADSWTISPGKVYACTLIPIIVGIYSLIVSLKLTFIIIQEKFK